MGSVIDRGIEDKSKKLMPCKSFSDFGKFAIKEHLAVVDDNYPATQLLDVLHVVAGQNSGDSFLFIVVEQKVSHVFLADPIKPHPCFLQTPDFFDLDSPRQQFQSHPPPHP